ncbi:MAG TPA: ABC transporter permease [bacterium]|nr:ABC transporter permease [bacterium]HQG46345.1 ABC transporter permease [bacterium]HQI47576.1 ABC transporter permease [bacterium]HQJ64354.1 ABC transporter permease [bacterium]HQJ65466.1 ABC transporter permease [bacterium]
MIKILHIIKKEFIQIRRDRSMLGILFVVPVVQLLLLGFVISSEVRNIRTVICDLDNSSASRRIVEHIRQSGYFNVAYYDPRPGRMQAYLDRGRAAVAVVIPEDFNARLQRGERTALQVLVDGQDSNTSTIALGYINGILQRDLTDQIEARLQTSEVAAEVHLVSPNLRVWYNEELKNSDYMVPGIVVFLLTMVTTLVSAMGLVREREIGTMEQLLVAPIKKHELLIGKLVPFAVLGLIELAFGLTVARIVYTIPLAGHLGLLILFALIYLFTTLGLGLFISASSATQQQAMFLTLFFLMFFLLMSGFLFPIENMPRVMQMISLVNPMRYFVLVVRELLIKGAGLHHLYTQGLALLVFGAVIFSFAVLRFQSRVK